MGHLILRTIWVPEHLFRDGTFWEVSSPYCFDYLRERGPHVASDVDGWGGEGGPNITTLCKKRVKCDFYSWICTNANIEKNGIV